MIYGIQVAKDVKLSNISRTLIKAGIKKNCLAMAKALSTAYETILIV